MDKNTRVGEVRRKLNLVLEDIEALEHEIKALWSRRYRLEDELVELEATEQGREL